MGSQAVNGAKKNTTKILLFALNNTTLEWYHAQITMFSQVQGVSTERGLCEHVNHECMLPIYFPTII